MNKFKIVPLRKEYTDRLKRRTVDNFGNTLVEQVSTGFGPCRLSLKPFSVGIDKRLLFKHNPFEIENAYNQSGPVFIHSEDVEEYADIYQFPPEIKADKINFPLSLIGYNKDQYMIYAQVVGDSDVEELITNVFSTQPEVEYLHVRNSEACCYICKVERL